MSCSGDALSMSCVRFKSPAPSPLRTRNYRLYFSGQIVSVPGTWLQTVAQAWLVLQLSSSGSALGVTVALQTVPVLILGAWTGSGADPRRQRRPLLVPPAGPGPLAPPPRAPAGPGGRPL